MPTATATALSHPNIAFIKYWGNRDQTLRLPANGSISMNLAGLHTRTQVSFDLTLTTDRLTINGHPAQASALARAQVLLDRVRMMSGVPHHAWVESENNFPMGTGIASSASAFAALTLASTAAAGLSLSQKDLSRLARTASGSACRSIPGGFVEWQIGQDDQDSYAYSIAPPEHWDLSDCVAVVSDTHKPTGSSEGHALAGSSPLQAGRVASTPVRLAICRRAIVDRDFDALAEVMELESNLMHAVMMTSTPPLMYWHPATLAIMTAVQTWRAGGIPACYTIDAGPNVHVICPTEYRDQISRKLGELPGVQEVLTTRPGGPAVLVE
jgi:diphosphomevalonate decarboxylase